MTLFIVFLTCLFLLTPHPWVMAATGETLQVQTDDLVVRGFGAQEAPAVITLKRGRKLKELRRQGIWIKVIIYGTTGLEGWVRASAVGPQQSDDLVSGPDTKHEGSEPGTSSGLTETDYILVIAGSSQAFKAVCIVIDRRGFKKRISIDGHGPRSYGLDGEATDCRVDRIDQWAGPLTAELYVRGNSLPLGSNSTAEAFGCVHVRSDGPWGSADGRRCSRMLWRF